eukprot:scaffold55606_cov55-Phaeocystis_antarctica.AAC.1
MSLLAEPRARSQERLSCVRWLSPLFAAPPLAPEYRQTDRQTVRIPNVFTSALNTRLNTRIHLPTPAYCPCRVGAAEP